MAKKASEQPQAPPADQPAERPAPAEPPRDIHAAKLLIMEAVTYIQKTKLKTMPYTALTEETVVAALHDEFVRVGIVIEIGEPVLATDNYPTTQGKLMNRSIVRVPYTLRHVGSGTSAISWGLGEGADVNDKSSPKSMTQAYKYMLRQTFMIATGDDPDRDDSAKTPRIDPNAQKDQASPNGRGSAPPATGAPATNRGSVPPGAATQTQAAPPATPQAQAPPAASLDKLSADERKQYDRVCAGIGKLKGVAGSRPVLLKYRRAFHERGFAAELVGCLESYWWGIWKETPGPEADPSQTYQAQTRA